MKETPAALQSNNNIFKTAKVLRRMKFETLLFDLDGTLTDPKKGITRSIRYALRKLGKPLPDADDLHWCIGPPLLDSLKKLIGNNDSAKAYQALTFYRERYGRIGKFENEVYSQIPDMLSQLNSGKASLFVATSKPAVYAIEILNHFGLAHNFRKIYGSELTGELSDKTELIQHIFNKEGIEKEFTVMVGDRRHDIIGARGNGIASIGVTYGYGTKDELINSGATWLADNPSDILNLCAG